MPARSVSLAYTFVQKKIKNYCYRHFMNLSGIPMSEIETGMQTRVRKGGQNENRGYRQHVYGEFTHFTSRPVDNVPDPHLHAHCFVFNATYDEIEDKWKAGEFGQLKKDAPYYEAVFHSCLANKLKSLGYGIEKSEKGFEIKGIGS
jgi:conjugative relaxase-like TrwC/TraI family protein